MIDRKHRRKGLGKCAIDFAIKLATDEGLRGVSLTTMDQAPKNALEFYTRLKFEATGRRLDGEIELILLH